MEQFARRGVAVIGISADPVAKQARFRDKYNLNMPLLSDPEKKTVSDYGALKEKNMYGKNVLGIERTTVLIGKDGIVKKIFPKVKVEGHVRQVLEALESV